MFYFMILWHKEVNYKDNDASNLAETSVICRIVWLIIWITMVTIGTTCFNITRNLRFAQTE
jgi:hypothetical protein